VYDDVIFPSVDAFQYNLTQKTTTIKHKKKKRKTIHILKT